MAPFDTGSEQNVWDWTQRVDQFGVTARASDAAELLRCAPPGADPDVLDLLRHIAGFAAPVGGSRSQSGSVRDQAVA